VSGQWGRKWSLEEVKAFLGHSSVKTTERYAKFAGDALMAAAKEMNNG
jgi:site-specific recombinase XerD